MDYYEDFEYNKPMSVKIWAKMLPFILPQKRKIYRTLWFMLICAVIDVAMPLILGYAIDRFIVPQTAEGMALFMALPLLLALTQGVVVKFFVQTALNAEVSISKSLRVAVFEHLQMLGLSYYNVTPVGYMMARTNSDTTRVGEMVAWGLVDFSWSLCYCVGVIIAMFIRNWRLALIVAAVIPVLAVMTWFFQRAILRFSRIVRKINSKMTALMNEGITGARTVKILCAEEKSRAEFVAVTGELKRNATRIALLRGIFTPLVMFAGSLVTAVVLARGGHYVLLGMELGMLATFINYAGGFFEPVHQIANVLSDFVATQANIERVTGLLEREPDVTDTPEVEEKYGTMFEPKRENWEEIKGEIEFEDVTFRYPDGNENVLEHFSLKIPQGTYVAIVGETGAGKSTLVNLLCRFFEPTEGRVLIDGRDCKERSRLWLHSSIGYVLQTPHLFSGTIRENIRYGRLDATDGEVEAAAALVSADAVIAKLEHGFDTDAGEGGDRLSTGEKQLISFARAILANPRIFVLDEATSSVDTETETLIQKAVARLLAGRTGFVIAHRLSTIRAADMILVVKDGRIIERGKHKELMRSRGHYYGLYTRQYEEDAEKTVLS
ncbi:MAG: ABC transporter ATP-binding protein/permease [Oscillospiraceae bacterium]|jgi:ATP-binding cassette subfamily B protein|nr:ABC transporter ATP-binding protein/permease [Oscillospiraceae bacterium]